MLNELVIGFDVYFLLFYIRGCFLFKLLES